MKNTFALLAFLLSFQPAFAALDCTTLKAKLEQWNPSKKDWAEVVIAKASLEEALTALPSPHAPSPAELAARLKNLRTDLEGHFPRYLDDNYANCTMRRAELRVALLRTSIDPAISTADRTRIRKMVLSSISSPSKFPTLISALADARVLAYGVDNKIWQTSDKTITKIKTLHEKVKTELAEENKTYGEPWGQVTAELKKLGNEEAQVKFLRESENFKKMRSHILAEPEESLQHLKELQTLAKEVRI